MKRSILFSMVLVIVCLSASTLYAGPWTTKTPMPTARQSGTSSAVNGKIYVMGGSTDGIILNLVEEYDTATDTWTTKEPMPTPRHHFGSCTVDGIVYAIGGQPGPDGEYSHLATVEAYDPSTDTWTIKTPMPSARGNPAIATVNGKIYAFGGRIQDSAGGDRIDSNIVEEYDPATDTWTTKTPMPTPRTSATASAVDGKIYVIGGIHCRRRCDPPLATVEEYDPATDTWTTKTPMPVVNYNSDGWSAAFGGRVYVIQNAFNYVYDPVTDTWKTRTPMPTIRGNAPVCAANGKIYVFGGSPGLDVVEEYVPTRFNFARLFSDAWQFDPSHYSFDASSIWYNGNIYWSMHTFAGTSGEPPVHPVYLDSPVYSDLSSDVPVQLNYTPDYYGPGAGHHWGNFFDFNGFAPPVDDWDNKTYTFFIDGNANGVLDPGEFTRQWPIPPNSIRQMEIPQNVTFAGGIHPTISWDPVQHADGYLVFFYALTDDGFVDFTTVLGSSSFIDNNFYTYTGDLFKDGKEYAVWVQARENHPWANPNSPPGAVLINRSGYFTKYQVVKIGDTGDNVEINPGEAAFIYDAQVDGNVEVTGGTVNIDGSSIIAGNVKSDGGEVIIDNGSTVEGNLKSKSGGAISVRSGSSVEGNVKAEGGIIEITGGSIVYGNVKAIDGTIVTIMDSTIYGNVMIKDSISVRMENNTIDGKLEIVNSTSCTESNNTVNGKNSGCP